MGSGHRLKIQTGRHEGVRREERLCKCDTEVQTMEHVIFRCELTRKIRESEFEATNLEEFFSDTRKACEKLRVMEKLLKVR